MLDNLSDSVFGLVFDTVDIGLVLVDVEGGGRWLECLDGPRHPTPDAGSHREILV
jgi:hypothetical protein